MISLSNWGNCGDVDSPRVPNTRRQVSSNNLATRHNHLVPIDDFDDLIGRQIGLTCQINGEGWRGVIGEIV